MARRSINKTLYNNVYPQYKPPEHKTTLQQNAQWAWSGLNVYKFVFTTNVAFGATLLLCLSLLLQPVAFTYAQETGTESPTNTSAEAASDPVTTDETDSGGSDESTDDAAVLPDNVSDNGDDEADAAVVVPDSTESESSDETTELTADSLDPELAATSTAAAADQSTSETDTSTTTTSVVADTNTGTATSSSDQSADPDNETSSNSDSSDTADTATTGAGNSASSGQEPTATTTADQETTGTGQSNNDSDNTATAVGSTTPTTAPAEPTLVSTVQTDNVFAFNKNECTEVEDGSYYCQKISYDTLAENDLFAAPDATGDMEIYVIQNGEQIKITDNAVDDASPYYDTRSQTIVWHRLIADRYQIISYNIETGTEEQITDTSVNNMEPTRNGSYTVWQRWVQNNWEIILLDDGVETQITDSVEHDIAPHIRGDLIIWNVRSSDGTQSLMTYDIGSEIFNEIKDTDGVSVSNPRMLVMYEAQYQNGDTVMKGFDLVTGEVIPIERIPRELPTDIPSPETTGEVRALPTNPQSEEDLTSDTDLDTDEPVDDVVQYDEDDLVLTASSTATTTPTVEVTDFDLDLRHDDSVQATTTNSAVVEQAAIPDVVVPEFNQEQVELQASSTQDQ
jgi:hypothetical protein